MRYQPGQKKKLVPIGVRFECPICKALSKRKDTTRTHMRRQHPAQSNLPIAEVQTGEVSTNETLTETLISNKSLPNQVASQPEPKQEPEEATSEPQPEPEQATSEPRLVISEKPKNFANWGTSASDYFCESEDNEPPAKEPEEVAFQPKPVISQKWQKSVYNGGACAFDSETEEQEPPAKRSATLGDVITQRPFVTKLTPICPELVTAVLQGDSGNLDDSLTSEYVPGADSDSENTMDFNQSSDNVFDNSFEADDPPPQDTKTTRKRTASTKSAPKPPAPISKPKQSNNVGGKSACPICFKCFLRRDKTRNHMKREHPEQANMDIGKGGERRSLCKFCHKQFSNVLEHQQESCPKNPDSIMNQKLLAKLKQAQAPKPSSKDFVAQAITSDQEDRQSQGSTRSVGSKGSQESRQSLQMFERGATRILSEFETWLREKSGLQTSVMTQYYNMSIRFFQYCEDTDPLFIADSVLTMNKKPQVVHLPGLDLFLNSLETDSIRQAACKMYAKLVKYLTRHLSNHFLNILSPAEYTMIDIRLKAHQCDVLEVQKLINKRAEKERSERNHEKLLSKDYKSNNEKTGQLMSKFLTCNYNAVELRDEYLDLDPARADAMTCEEILTVRNYIMANLLLLGGGNRGDSLRNMTLREFNNKHLDPKTNHITVYTLDHKTGRKGAALTPFLSPDLLQIAELYGKLFRPKLTARRNMGQKDRNDRFGKKFEENPEQGDDATPFFLSKHGHYLVKIDVVVDFIKKVLKTHCGEVVEKGFTSRCFRNWCAQEASSSNDPILRANAFEAMNHSEQVNKQFYVNQKASQKVNHALQFLEKLGATGIVKSSRAATTEAVEENQDQPSESRSRAAATTTQEKQVFRWLTAEEKQICYEAMAKYYPSLNKETVEKACQDSARFRVIWDKLLLEKKCRKAATMALRSAIRHKCEKSQKM